MVKDLQIPPESFMETDFIVTMGTVRERGSDRHVRRVNEFVSTGTRPGTFTDVSDRPRLLKSNGMKRILSSTTMTGLEAINEINIRAGLRKFLAEMGTTKGEGYLGPEWIVLANDHLKRCISSGMTDVDEVVNSFRQRFNDVKGAIQ